MTDKALAEALEKLAARVESATGPDRGLDGEIQLALDPLAHNVTNGAIFSENGHFVGPLPLYSASIDAATALIPEGWSFLGGTIDGRNFYDVWIPHGELGHFRSSGATTPALALTAACLRAMAHSGA